jgi:hypothetical protein
LPSFVISFKDTGIGMSETQLEKIRATFLNDDYISTNKKNTSASFMLGIRSINYLTNYLNEHPK